MTIDDDTSPAEYRRRMEARDREPFGLDELRRDRVNGDSARRIAAVVPAVLPPMRDGVLRRDHITNEHDLDDIDFERHVMEQRVPDRTQVRPWEAPDVRAFEREASRRDHGEERAS